VIIGSLLYSVDSENSALVTSVIREAEVPRREIAWLTGNSKEFKLHLCTNIPFGATDNFCTTAFDSRHGNFSIPVAVGFRRSVRCLTALCLAHFSFAKTDGRNCKGV